MANRRFTQFYYTLHNKPCQLDWNFVVDSTNVNGLGISSLKGPGIASVVMNTGATPAASNPNPIAGMILVRLQDNYQKYFAGNSQFQSPQSGTPIIVTAVGAHLSVGTAYVITKLGTTTAANWVTMGLPVGTTAALGVSFIAIATGAGTGSGEVQVSKTGGSGIDHIELVGDPNLSINSSAANVVGISSGSYLIYKCLSGGTLTAPSDGTVIYMNALMSSSIITNGAE